MGIPSVTTLRLQAVSAIIAFLGTAVLHRGDRLDQAAPTRDLGRHHQSITLIVNAALMKAYPATSTNTGAHWGSIVMIWVFQTRLLHHQRGLSRGAIPDELFGTAWRTKGVSSGRHDVFCVSTR